MKPTHGNSYQAELHRIADMAEAIYRGEATTDEQLHDTTDINTNEEAEIAAARKLAQEWARREWIEAWHVWHRPAK